MDAFSEGFGLGFVFCAVLSGALLLVVSRSTGGGASEDPEQPESQG